MAVVTGAFAVGTATLFVTAHALIVKGIGPGGNDLGVGLVLLGERPRWGLAMAAHASLVVREGLLVLDPELFIERRGMTGSACQRLVLVDIVVVTIGALESIVLGMSLVSEDDPAAVVVHDDAGRNVLLCLRLEVTTQDQQKHDGDNRGDGEVSLLQWIIPL
jgi:hypothetical protein